MAKRQQQDDLPAIPVEHVALYKSVRPQMRALLDEIRELSKKHPDGPINKFKLRFINEKLQHANTFLSDEHRPLKGFEQFDVDDLPTNSDVVLILSQYSGALHRWQEHNTFRHDTYGNVWRTNPLIRVE